MDDEVLAALHEIMGYTQQYALGYFSGDFVKKRAARKLLSRHQDILDRHGLTWVPGRGIVRNGKP